MPANYLQEEVFNEVEPIVTGMGFKIVELKVFRSRKQNRLYLVVYRREGVGINDCTAISRNISPRLELIEEFVDPTIEVSTPGIKRVIKSREEFILFEGRGVRILLHNEQEWRGGLIEGATPDALILKKAGKTMEIKFAEIKKARLDYTQEVNK